jgi:hypothetical protein
MAPLSDERYQKEVEKFLSDPENYVTPGARRYYHRVVAGFVVLAVAFTAGVWAITNLLRQDLNDFLILSCKASIPTLTKFNQSLQADIDIQRDAQLINLAQKEYERAKLNQRAIEFKTNAMLDVPTEKECEARKAF